MFRRLPSLLFLAALAGASSQCRKAPVSSAPSGGETLAVVAGRPVTEEDLLREAEWRRANRQAIPEPEVLLDEMVNRLSLVELARRSGFEDEPATRRRIESLLIARLRESRIDGELAKVEVTDDEARASYEARAAEFVRTGLDRFAILFQAVSSKSSEARRAEARQRLEAALALADANPAPGGRGPAASGFGSVAIEYSDDQTGRYRGGDIGWIESGAEQTRWPAAVLEAGRALEKGARSGIVEADDGLYVIMKTDERPGGVRPFEEVSERVRQGLLAEKRRVLEERFIADARESADAAIYYPDTARKVSLPAPQAPPAPPDEPPAFPGIVPPSASR